MTQGEIHMSDDAIHDILEQTESDPAFQALFDLFDYSNFDTYAYMSSFWKTKNFFFLFWNFFFSETHFVTDFL